MRIELGKALLMGFFVIAGRVGGAELAIYDEVLQNGFSTAYSYGGGTTVGSTAQAHGGTKSVAFVGSNFNAVAFTHATTYSTADYPVLHFWIYGSSPGTQDLDIEIYDNKDSGMPSKLAPLNGYIAGGSVGNGAVVGWREVTIPLTTPPLSFSGTFNRFDIQSEANGAAQTAVYIDDVSLQLPVLDPIFHNGFDPDPLPPAANGLVQDTVTIDNLLSDRFTWKDSQGQTRVAVLAHNDNATTAPGGSHGGELREFRYQTAGGQRIVSAPGRDDGGFGYVVSHPADERSNCVAGHDSSTLGHLISGTWERIFTGRHHAIFRFHQNYPRYCSTKTPVATRLIPVTIDWIFSTGRDNPTWSVTYDMTALPADIIKDDSRAPYGTMNIDGSSGTFMDNEVGGITWGDEYVFTTTSPATMSSTWTWNSPNTIPFMELWMSGVDATMGLTQTQTISQQDAGGGRKPYGNYDVSAYWNAASPTVACPDGSFDGQTGVAHSMPCVQYWPYQANSFSYTDITNPTNDAKMTWGTQYGFLGQTAYPLNDSTLPAGSTASGYPLKSYSVYVIFGEHSGNPVGTQSTQVDTMQSVTLSINGGIGTVAGSGAAGVNRVDTRAYSPAGYDPIASALTFDAVSNALDATIAVGTGTLNKPLIVIRNYTSEQYPTTVKIGGTTLTVDTDYFPSMRASTSELWITLNRNLSGASNRLQITP
jgi:hypothetical protein